MPAACPVCAAPADPKHQPFCGRGCRDRDLLQWLGEGYRLPGRRADHDAPGPGWEGGVDKAGDAA